MTCEVCGEETSEATSVRPVDEDYFTYVGFDNEDPEIGTGTIEYEFCSIECLQMFVPENPEDR